MGLWVHLASKQPVFAGKDGVSGYIILVLMRCEVLSSTRLWKVLMKNAVLTFALAVLLAAMFTGCGPREVVEAPDYEYRIGALLDLSGPNASAGAIELTAIRAAVEVANAKLEASGSRMSFTVLSCDTAGNPGNAMQCMRGLVSRKVIAVIGPSSDAEMTAVKPEANRSGVMLLSYGGGSTSHSVESDYVLRLVPDYSQQAALLEIGRAHV